MTERIYWYSGYPFSEENKPKGIIPSSSFEPIVSGVLSPDIVEQHVGGQTKIQPTTNRIEPKYRGPDKRGG